MMMLCWLVVSVLMVWGSEGAAAYCGSLEGFHAKVRIIQLNETALITLDANGIYYMCPQTKYEELGNGSIVLPGIHDPKTCVGGILKYVKVDPSSIQIWKDRDDTVHIDARDWFNMTLLPCVLQAEEELPRKEKRGSSSQGLEGTYYHCSVARSHITFLDSHSFDFAYSFPTGDTLECYSESYHLSDNNKITLPDFADEDNCIGQQFRRNSFDPDLLTITYNEHSDKIDLHYTFFTLTFTRTKCGL
eukprot:TRINITY_DN859_c0_g1_i1.p1 TRINITY_DN859_c0_g1~~TRINITY_DN859_c0_g1_i1.p1  ORF type:complete len:246 (-),score=43.28 TRINITY_DN859_c0_g1_i1:59-796(-)